MIETKVNTDPISEKYRKYVLGLTIKDQFFYVLHGSDTTTFNGDDKFLVNSNGMILLFQTIPLLINYIRICQFNTFDSSNTLEWADEYKGKIPYSTIDFDRTFQIVNSPISLHAISQSDTIHVVDFINTFGDYAYQREKDDPTLLLLHRKEEVRTFFDFAYDNYVWDNSEHAGYRSLNEIAFLQFDELKFRKTIQKMLEKLTDSTTVWENRDESC